MITGEILSEFLILSLLAPKVGASCTADAGRLRLWSISVVDTLSARRRHRVALQNPHRLASPQVIFE